MSQDYLDKLIEKDKAGTQIQSIPLHDTELRGITIDDPITVEGNPINFSTKNEQNAIQTVVNLEPIQDLHGYSKPWVGGAGKNLIQLTVDGIKARNSGMTWNGNSTTYNNVTFTILTDNDNNVTGIKVNGTAQTSNANLHLPVPSINLSGHILNGCPSGGGTSTYYIRIAAPTSNYFSDYGSGATITNNQTLVSCWIGVPVGGSANNLIFYPMLRLSTVTDSTFEPYTNICPILPHEEIKIEGCGKNLWDPINVLKAYFNSSNPITSNATARTIYINCAANEKYVVSKTAGTRFYVGYTKVLPDVGVEVYGIVDNNTATSINITTGLDAKYLVAFVYNESTDTITADQMLASVQIEKGQTKTSYEPYTLSNQLTLPLPDDVYGGTLNLETGELVVDRKIAIFNGGSGENWSYQGGSGSTLNRHYIQISGSNQPKDTAIILNLFDGVAFNDRSFSTNGIAWLNNDTTLSIMYNDISSVSDFRTFLASNNLQVVYELSTPYTLQLTPSQLKLFKDVNNLNSSDYTTLTVTYHSNSIATLAPATDTTDGLLSAIDKRALDRTEEIIEGNPIAFETESAQIAKSTIVDLEPIQDLHGFTKPWVGGAGKNLLPITVDSIKTLNSAGTWSGNEYTHNNGMKFTLLVDSDNNLIGIKANGTFNSSGGTFVLYNGSFTAGSYHIRNLCSTTISGGEYTLQATPDGSSTTIYVGTNSGSDITISAQVYIRMAFGANITLNNVTFTPLLVKQSVTDYTFEPYTNIASISGRSEVYILGCGKNLFDSSPNSWIQGYLSVDDGYTTSSNAYWCYNEIFYYTTPGTIMKMTANQFMRTTILFYDINKGYITMEQPLVQDFGNIIIPDRCYYYRFAVNVKGATVEITPLSIASYEIQVEFGSTATTYSPYIQSTSLQIQLGQTVYGGQLNVENGVLVVNKAGVDLGDLDWTDLGTAVSGAARFKTTLTNKPVKSDLTNGSTSYCSHYDLLTDGGTYTADKDGYTISTTDIVLFVDAYKTSSTSAFKTAMSGVQVVYTLQDEYKTTISLTPEQVKLLQGVNTITTNADNITLTYRNGSVATLNDLESLYAKLKAYIDSLHSS